jgi:hypothetical protein
VQPFTWGLPFNTNTLYAIVFSFPVIVVSALLLFYGFLTVFASPAVAVCLLL